MNILLFNVPSRRGSGGFMLPLGLLYVGGIIERCGHKAKIIDLYLDDTGEGNLNLNRINKIIDDYKPSIIGYGGIATSYGRTKKISLYIKKYYPKIIQIAGGALSSVYELLLTKANIDAVVHGEAEVSLPLLLQRFDQKESIYGIPGISYSSNRKIVKNPPAEQIKDLDTIPFPAYHLVDMSRYLQSVREWLDAHKLSFNNPHYADLRKKIENKHHYIPIVTARGCTNRCSFCYRHVRGVRQHSVNYVTDHIKYLKETYGVNGFQFSDELFNSRREWVIELCDAMEENNLDIFYIVAGARIDKTDEEMLRRLKDTGCIGINYGQESGSDKILREYRKGVTSHKNREITKLTKEAGIFSVVQLVIGSPGETTDTIYETIQFLKDVDAYNYSLNYLIPLPETPIWQYVKENGLIEDVEEYLDLVAEQGGNPLINLTKESDKVWKSWSSLISHELRLHRYWKANQKLHYYSYKFLHHTMKSMYPLIRIFAPLIPRQIKKPIAKWMDI